MKKYLLEENVVNANDEIVELGYDHCIATWTSLPGVDDIDYWIKESINKHWKNRKVNECYYTLYEVDANSPDEEWSMLKQYSYEIDKARTNKNTIEYHKEFIDYVDSFDNWSDVETYEYEDHLEDVGLNYNNYDDPDMMWESYKKAIVNLEVKVKEI